VTVLRKRDLVTIPMLKRMRELRAAGCSCSNIAIVLRLDYGVSIKPGTVKVYTRGLSPNAYRAGTLP